MPVSSRSIRRLPPKPHPRPASVLDPALAGRLLDLHAALDLDSLWSALVHLIDSALPVNDLIAALPYEGLAPMTFRTTVEVDDMHAYRLRLEKAEPPMARLIAENPGLRTAFLDDQMTPKELLASPFYRHVMEPDGVRHVAALLFWSADNHFIAHVGLNRTALQGPFTPAERSLLEQLHPHLHHAIHRIRLLDSRQALIQMLQQALDHPMEGVILLNSREQVVFHNAAAAEACAWWRGGRTAALVQPRKSAPFSLPSEIREQASLLLGRFRARLSGPLSDPPRTAKPLESVCRHPAIKGLQAALTVVVPADQAEPPHIRIRVSRVSKSQTSLPLHLLTQAEFRSARLASGGLRNEEIAAHLGVSVNTIRAHLRAVFDKLGIRHRGELVHHFD